ncbi:MAG: AarF/ABC1/UbiB kinase family protein, partial [Thermomicrobiales bacterium]
ALLDFGAVGRIDPGQQAALRAVLGAFQRHDAAELRLALLELAVETPAELNTDALERALARFMAQRLGTDMELNAVMFNELFALLLQFGLTFPPEVGEVFRAVVMLEGTLRVLAPGFQLIDEARTLAVRWVKEGLTPVAISETVTDEVQALLPMLRRLPRRVDRISEAIERGSLAVNVRLFADERDARLISTLVSRAILAFLGAAIGLMSVLLLGAPGGPVLVAQISLFQALGYLGLCVSIILILRVINALVRDRLV